MNVGTCRSSSVSREVRTACRRAFLVIVEAIEPDSHVQSSRRGMPYPANQVQEHSYLPEPHHDPSCIIIHSSSFTEFFSKLWIVQGVTENIKANGVMKNDWAPKSDFTKVPCLNNGGGVAIYRPFGEFRRANLHCHLYGSQGQGQRQAYF
ncbi:hypothetical protein TNCV_4482431 [Trichonephila clavipes]|nr:hypothetical protein TNCV_4482431 [Trichonephila clavipes]